MAEERDPGDGDDGPSRAWWRDLYPSEASDEVLHAEIEARRRAVQSIHEYGRRLDELRARLLKRHG